MKTLIKSLAALILIFCFSNPGNGQVLKNLGNRVKDKVNQRIGQRTDQAIDKGMDEAEKAGKSAKNEGKTKDSEGNGNDKRNDKDNDKINTERDDISIDNKKSSSSTDKGSDINSGVKNKTSAPAAASFAVYSKFDFIPGDKVIAYDDFAKDEIGDFPVSWNTNSSGEVVTSTANKGNWLMLRKKGIFVPEYIKALPENFTFEYDVVTNDKFDYSSPALQLFFITGSNKKGVFDTDFISWEKRSGVRIGVHPTNGYADGGVAYANNYEDGEEVLKNKHSTLQFNSQSGKTKVHVSVWRQKQRVRIYLNEEKVYDMPRAFPAGKTYSAVLFELPAEMQKDADRYLVGNIKLSSGAPDTRNALLSEGRFVTRGIQFDVNSDNIKPESYGVLKEIATVLSENESLNVKIVGHTDADGTDADNLTLSKRRSESVKQNLVKNFGISASRLQTDGKGESQPADNNTTAAAKANNRRVEFIKL